MAFDDSLSVPPADPVLDEDTSTTTSAPKTRRDVALDGLRGLAVLMVFLFHYGGGLQSTQPSIRLIGFITQGSWLGIILFFALSGFLITGSLWDTIHQRHRLRNFYVRRALRILPLYILALTAAAVAAILAGAAISKLKPLLIFVFFLQDFPHLATAALHYPAVLPLYHFWTLAVEEQFYLLWPIILFFAHSRRHALRLSLWFFAITVIFLLSVYTLPAFKGARIHHLYDYFLFTQSSALALGCAVSLAMGNRATLTGRKPGTHRIIRKYAQPAFFTGLGIYLFTSYYAGTLYLSHPLQFWLGLPAISVAAAAAIPLVLRNGLPRKVFSFAPLAWLGRISYGFYVYHILLEPWFGHLGAQISHTDTGDYYHIVRAVMAFVLTCAISWLSFTLYETPILSLKRFFPLSPSLPWGEPITETPRSHRRRSRSRQ
ncbi:MAG: acyltransferase [Acidobacteriaceae bacterium]